jgi:hypothetical protein
MSYRRARPLLAALFFLGVVAACESETGPGAPARTNGCIDEECTLGTAKDGGQDATQDAQ